MQELLKNLNRKYPDFWQGDSPTHQTRRKTLQFLLVAYCIMGVLLAIILFAQHGDILLLRVILFTGLSGLGFLMLRQGVSIQKVGHYVLICLYLIILSTTLLYKKGHYLVNFQFIFVIVSLGFYVLGARWGLFYSTLSTFTAVAVIIVNQYFKVEIATQIFTAEPYSFTFALIYNSLMLLYIHYFFFKESELSAAKEAVLLSELKFAAAQSRDLADYKTNFLITMSHEIRTPLHAIMGGLDLINPEHLPAEQGRQLGAVRFSSDLLNSIIDDILNLDEIDHGQTVLSKKTFQPGVVVSDIFRTLQPAAKDKGLSLTLNISPGFDTLWVTGDPVRLAQIVMNLISNAVKYTEHGHVNVMVKTKQAGDEKVQFFFDVSDSGIGIPSEVFPYIFEPFKLVNTKKQYHGTGLGLSLAQRIVDLHGGKLDFKSQEGVGTSFFFDFTYPLATMPLAAGKTSSRNDLTSLEISVLAAEDNSMNAMILRKFLEKWGVRFDIVENGLEAVEMMHKNSYQVILMDINMPLMDGIEASRKIRNFESPVKAKIPIIALTATNKEALSGDDTLALFDDWIAKPFHPQILHAKLAAISLSKV